MDVVALKTPKLRGQAWVAFSEVTSASNAVRQMQNFPFYDKPMVSLSFFTLTNTVDIFFFQMSMNDLFHSFMCQLLCSL